MNDNSMQKRNELLTAAINYVKTLFEFNFVHKENKIFLEVKIEDSVMFSTSLDSIYAFGNIHVGEGIAYITKIDPSEDFIYSIRPNYKHMTLGELIDVLKTLPKKENPVFIDAYPTISIGNPHSFRGFYTHLALEPTDLTINIEELISLLESCIDRSMTGYKGGEFIMTRDTPLWISKYGTSENSRKIIGCRKYLHVFYLITCAEDNI